MELLPLPPLSTAGSSTGVATDITKGNQGDKKCSYSDHVEQQFWEYVAQIELVYMLATDEETRALLVEAVKKSAREGSIYALNSYGQYLASRSAATQFRELAKLYFPDIEERIARGLVDNDTHNAYLDHLARANKIEREGQQAKNNADAFVKEAADKFYKELTQRLEECGWFYASATLATDAALIAAEALATAGIGVAALKGLRLSANIITKGAKKVGEEAIPVAVAAQIHLQSGAVVTKTFSIAHLKGRYGTPMEHHAGTLAKEKNRGRSDGGDDTEQSETDTRPKTKRDGDLAEAAAREKLKEQGYTETMSIENNSGHGIDVIGRNPETGDLKVLEVKANGAGLSEKQAGLGGPEYLQDRLREAQSRRGVWAPKNLPAGMSGNIKKLRKWLKSAPSEDYKIWKIKADADTGETGPIREADWNYGPGKKPKKLSFREIDQSPATGKSDKAIPPSTGPPIGK